MNETLIACLGIFLGLFYSIGTLVIPVTLLNFKKTENPTKALLGCFFYASLIYLYYILPTSFQTAVTYGSWTAIIITGILLFIGVSMFIGYIVKPLSKMLESFVEKHLSRLYFWLNKNNINKQDFIGGAWIIISILIGNAILFFLNHPLTIDALNKISQLLNHK